MSNPERTDSLYKKKFTSIFDLYLFFIFVFAENSWNAFGKLIKIDFFFTLSFVLLCFVWKLYRVYMEYIFVSFIFFTVFTHKTNILFTFRVILCEPTKKEKRKKILQKNRKIQIHQQRARTIHCESFHQNERILSFSNFFRVFCIFFLVFLFFSK
jgi:hypothetical protein